MIKKDTLKHLFKAYGFDVEESTYYLRITNPKKNITSLLPSRRQYGWWRIRIYLSLDRQVWNLQHTIFYRTLRNHAEANKYEYSQKQHQNELKKNKK